MTTSSEDHTQSAQILKKIKFLEYFGRFDAVTRFLQILCVIFVFISIFSTGSALWFYNQATDKTKEIVSLVKTTRQYLEQQEMQNIFVFSVRIATDYFSMSAYNAKDINERFVLFLHPQTALETQKELQAYADVLIRGNVTQNLEKLSYDQITITSVDDQSGQGLQQWLVQIPVKVFVSKEGADKTSRYETKFGMYIVKSEKSLTNPFGLRIAGMGKIQD